MDSFVPGPIEARAASDCDVGQIWCEGYGVLPQDEGLLMVDPVLTSDEQVAPLPPGRLVFDVLVNVESLVGKEGSVLKRHGRCRRQIGREVGDMGKSD